MAKLLSGPGRIGCCVCLNRGGKRVEATTVVKGYAVCANHVDLVSQPEFDIFAIGKQERRVL